MLSVHHNQKQVFAHRALNTAEQQSHVSNQRLASGQRINSAADDSAGLQISNRLSTRIKSADQTQRNLADGLSYCQIAEGALQEVSEAILRMRTLAVYAQDGALTSSDRGKLQMEFSSLATQIDNVAHNTVAFGKHPLLGDISPTLGNVASIDQTFTNGQPITMNSGLRSIAYIPAGTEGLVINLNDHGANDDIQLFTRSGRHLAGTALGSQTWSTNSILTPADLKTSFLHPADGYFNSAAYDASSLSLSGSSAYNGMNISFSGDQNAASNLTEQLQIDRVTEPLILAVTGSGAFTISLNWTQIGQLTGGDSEYPDEGPVRITASPTAQAEEDFIKIDKAPATLSDLAMNNLALDPVEKAEQALAALSDALTQVDHYRTTFGSKIAQLHSASRQMSDLVLTHAQALSQIKDTDFARQVAESVSTQILADAAKGMLAQANAVNSSHLNTLLGSV